MDEERLCSLLQEIGDKVEAFANRENYDPNKVLNEVIERLKQQLAEADKERLEAAEKVMNFIDSLPQAIKRTRNTDFNRVSMQRCVYDQLYELRAAYDKTKEPRE